MTESWHQRKTLANMFWMRALRAKENSHKYIPTEKRTAAKVKIKKEK